MRPILALVVTLIALAAVLPAQTLQHERYRLPNGMTVILHEDHSLPVATINLWYRVGARNEPPGRSGFAHLFEHLMFMGTKRVPGSDFDNLMEAEGGANNASTALDRTNYYSWGPASLLPTLLWLDADRMEDLGPEMTPEKLQLQVDVVRNEIRQNVENRPYGRAEEESYRLLYPEGHPYHNAVYGSHADLAAATVNDVRDFFATFYQPANCSLVIAGDFDPAKIKPLVAELFGTLPGVKPPPQVEVPPARLQGRDVRRTLLDKVQLPKLALAYHSPARYAEGDAECELLADILADGKASRLYKRLVVQDGSAVSVSAYQGSAALGSLLQIEVLGRPGADLSAIEKAVDEELKKLIEEGPTPDEVAQRALATEAQFLARLQSVRARADKLNEYLYYFGEPDALGRDLERYRNASVRTVLDAARQVLTQPRLVQWILPEQRQPGASPRDARPEAAAQKSFAPPEPVSFTLSNGIPVQLWSRSDLPLVATQLMFMPKIRRSLPPILSPPRGGRTVGPEGLVDRPERAGLGSLVASMTQEGAADLDGAAFAEAVSALGGTLRANAGRESLTLTAQVLARNFGAATDLLADAALRPRMDPADFERLKQRRLSQIRQQRDRPTTVASNVAAKMLLGARNPYAWPLSGTAETVSALTLQDVHNLHGSLFRPDFATLFVAGDISADEARAALEKSFGAWEVHSQVSLGPDDLAHPTAEGLRLFVVDRPGAVQTVINLMVPGVRYASPERLPLRMVTTILGGSFTSRLNRNLREVHGYTYGARANDDVRRAIGFLSAQTSVQAAVTGPALREFLGELTRISSGDISAEEVQKARETVRNDIVQSFGTLFGILGNANQLHVNGASLEALAADYAALATFDATRLTEVARDIIRLDHAVLVLVGDRATILEQIEGQGLPEPTFLDATGNPVGKSEPEGGR